MNNVHVIYASPRRDGFLYSCLEFILSKLEASETQVKFVDLYRCGFDPVLGEDDLDKYYQLDAAPDDVRELTNFLLASDTLIFVFPIWMYAMPAILKGYFDKIWRPNVTFTVENGVVRPLLSDLKKIIVVCSSGQADLTSNSRTPDLAKSFFERLAAQNTIGPATVDYVKFDGRDAETAGGEGAQKAIAVIDNILNKLLI